MMLSWIFLSSNLCTADSSQDSSSDKENESPDLENEEPSEDDSHEDEIDTILPMQPERPGTIELHCLVLAFYK